MTLFVRNFRWAVNCSHVLFALSLPPALWIFFVIVVRAAERFAHIGLNPFTGVMAIYFAVIGGWLLLLVLGLVQLRRHSRWLLEHPRALRGGFEVMPAKAGQ